MAEARRGELFNQLPKATTNHKQQNLEIPDAGKFLTGSDVEKPKPKLEVAAEMGFNTKKALRNQGNIFLNLFAREDDSANILR